MERADPPPVDAWPTTPSAGVQCWNCRDTPAPAARTPTAAWQQPPLQDTAEMARPPALVEAWLLRQQRIALLWQQEQASEACKAWAASGASGVIQRNSARQPARQRRTQSCTRSNPSIPSVAEDTMRGLISASGVKTGNGARPGAATVRERSSGCGDVSGSSHRSLTVAAPGAALESVRYR